MIASPSEKTRSRVSANAHVAAFHLFLGTSDVVAQAAAFIITGKANLKRANEREQLYIATLDAWIKHDIRKASALHKAIAEAFLRDLVSLDTCITTEILVIVRECCGLQKQFSVPTTTGVLAVTYQRL